MCCFQLPAEVSLSVRLCPTCGCRQLAYRKICDAAFGHVLCQQNRSYYMKGSAHISSVCIKLED